MNEETTGFTNGLLAEIEILKERNKALEARDVVTPEYLQSWIERANEAESKIKELEDKLEQQHKWLTHGSICPECGDSPLRAHYSGGRAIRTYCNRRSCDWSEDK